MILVGRSCLLVAHTSKYGHAISYSLLKVEPLITTRFRER